jgi:hypothetical protein
MVMDLIAIGIIAQKANAHPLLHPNHTHTHTHTHHSNHVQIISLFIVMPASPVT